MIRQIIAEAAGITLEVTGVGENAKINVKRGVSAINRVQRFERMLGRDGVYSNGMWINLLNGPKSRRSLQIALRKNLTSSQLFVSTEFTGDDVFVKDVVVVNLIDANTRAARK
jgi:hypothetical protein